jgi:hypothetical protein
MAWISGKRDFYAACDLDFGQARFSCCLRLRLQTNRDLHDACGIESQTKRDLHAVYCLGFRQGAVSMMPAVWFSGKRDLYDIYGLGFRQALSS